MSVELSGRRIMITGAASGMGRAIAELFSQHGAATALLDRDAGGLANVQLENAIAIPTDVSSPEAVADAVAQASETMGGIDGIVNAAGILRVIPFAETDLSIWRQVQDINLTGPYLVCHAALPHLKAAAQATIVNISSLAGLIAPKGMSAYAASKAGLIGLTRVLAAELGPTIRVNCIAPGVIKTAMTDALFGGQRDMIDQQTGHLALGRAGEAHEVAELALFLTSARSSFITGHTNTIDGGSSWY